MGLLNIQKISSLNIDHTSNSQYLDCLSTKSEKPVTEVGDFLMTLKDERMNYIKDSVVVLPPTSGMNS